MVGTAARGGSRTSAEMLRPTRNRSESRVNDRARNQGRNPPTQIEDRPLPSLASDDLSAHHPLPRPQTTGAPQPQTTGPSGQPSPDGRPHRSRLRDHPHRLHDWHPRCDVASPRSTPAGFHPPAYRSERRFAHTEAPILHVVMSIGRLSAGTGYEHHQPLPAVTAVGIPIEETCGRRRGSTSAPGSPVRRFVWVT